MAESLESLVEKFRINLTETIQKLEEENRQKDAALEIQHKQEMELLDEKEKIEREKLDATQKIEREELDATQKFEREELIAKQSQRVKDLTVKQHQEKEKLKNYYGGKIKEATMENKMCTNTSKKEVPECPVCLEPMNPPMRIFQCSYGHYICENCNNNKEIKSCPTCRRKIVGRNIGMEQAIQLIGSPTDIFRGHQREAVQNKGLTCDTCTLINKEGAKKCDACGAPLGMVPTPIRPAYSPNSVEYPSLMMNASQSEHGQSTGRGQSTARGVYGQSSVGDRRGNISVGVGRGRYRSLLQPPASSQSRPVGVGRGFPPGVPSVNTDVPSHRFPAPVPSGHAMGANRLRMHVPTGRLVDHVPTGRLVDHVPTGRLVDHVPTGRLVDLETQSPPRNRTSTGRQRIGKGGGRARDFHKPCGERIDNWDFVYDSLEEIGQSVVDVLGLD